MKQLRPLRRSARDLVPYSHSSSILGCHNYKAFHLSYPSLLQSQDSLYHNMACSIYLPRSSNIEMYLEAVIKRVWRCTWRRCWSELEGHDWASLEMHFDVMINGDWGSTWRWSIWDGRSGGRLDGSWDSIHWLTRNRGNVESWVQQSPPRDERLPGSRRQSILGRSCTHGICCTRYILYLEYTVLGVCCTQC